MTALANQPIPFHLGFVVHDLDEATARYGALLGIPEWHRWSRTGRTIDLRIAYGRAAGVTIEMLQLVRGDAPMGEFLRRHGEGLQHIGMWVADVRQAVADAVAKGASIEWVSLLGNGQGLVNLSGTRPTADVLERINPGAGAFLNPGVGVERDHHLRGEGVS